MESKEESELAQLLEMQAVVAKLVAEKSAQVAQQKAKKAIAVADVALGCYGNVGIAIQINRHVEAATKLASVGPAKELTHVEAATKLASVEAATKLAHVEAATKFTV